MSFAVRVDNFGLAPTSCFPVFWVSHGSVTSVRWAARVPRVACLSWRWQVPRVVAPGVLSL